jgi:hypothetical protein
MRICILFFSSLVTFATAAFATARSGELIEHPMRVTLWPRVDIVPAASAFVPVGNDAASVLTIVVSIRNAGRGPVRLLSSCHTSSLASLERLVDGSGTEWHSVYVPVRVMRLDPACEIAPGTTRVDSATIRVATDPAFRVPVERLPGTYRAVYSIFDPNAGPSDSTVAGRGRELPESLRRSASFRIER